MRGRRGGACVRRLLAGGKPSASASQSILRGDAPPDCDVALGDGYRSVTSIAGSSGDEGGDGDLANSDSGDDGGELVSKVARQLDGEGGDIMYPSILTMKA